MTDKIIVLSTCANAADAEKLARSLLEKRIAACVNVIPAVRSFYHWQGALEAADECILIIKSSRDLFETLRAELETLHPYDVPEVLAFPVVAGSEGYLNWLEAELRA